jgi:putative redox protein
MTITAHLQRDQGSLTRLSNGRHEWLADIATGIGGGDAAPDPHDLLDSALAACTALTLELYIRRKGLAVTKIDVQIEHEESPGLYKLQRRIQIEGELADAERQRLLEIANRCPIHRILSGEIQIQTELS